MLKHKNLFRMVAVVLTISILMSTGIAYAFAEDSADAKKELPIDTPYEYPITPNSKKEWLELCENGDRWKASEIPEEVLGRLTTEALIETIANYPMKADLFAYNSLATGYQEVKLRFNGLRELEQRAKENPAEVRNALESYIDVEATRSSDGANSVNCLFVDGIKVMACPYVYTRIPAENSSRYSISSITTPKGSSVSVYYGLVWADMATLGGMSIIGTINSAAAARNIQAQLLTQYPSMEPLQVVDPSYNCHSYAFYSTSTSNPYWMNNPRPYLTDGSYLPADYGYQVGDIAVYYTQSNLSSPVHSGIVSGVSGSSLTHITSKWSCLGVYRHRYNDCPYYVSPTNATAIGSYYRNF